MGLALEGLSNFAKLTAGNMAFSGRDTGAAIRIR